MNAETFASPTMRHVRKIHFVGIGGSGMSGIAEVLVNMGYSVSGSDLVHSSTTVRLSEIGVEVFVGHHADHVGAADVVVQTSAVGNKNVELIAAHAKRIPVISRAEMLGELMRHRFGIAVAGSHGKTTTTALISSIFQTAGIDPTVVIGGILKSERSGSRLGISKYLIAEADESDASFLYLQPMVSVVTNIDHEHMSTYGHDFGLLCDAFSEFIHRLPFYGVASICIDDENLRNMIPALSRPVLTYGLSEDADFRAIDIREEGTSWQFTAVRPPGYESLEIELPIPGIHYVQNALAAVVVATDEGLESEYIQSGIRNFDGVGRRFEISEVCIGTASIQMVDDYGHHPTEVRSVLQTARKVWPDKRIVLVYQPHRYSRTRDLFEEFVDVLSEVDELVMLATYSAHEEPVQGADACSLLKAIKALRVAPCHFALDPPKAIEILLSIVKDNDLVITQGAGNVGEVSESLRQIA